jgi:DnaJ-class molecular chaperone
VKKTHGPALNRKQIPLQECHICHGRAVIRGIFHQIACDQCNGSGWVDEMGSALCLEELVVQLSFKLQMAQRQMNEIKRTPTTSGAGEQYEQNNRRGAGGSNYTGD